MASDDESNDPPSETTEPVGYGKPPTAHRFKPGRSGNPKGRPKNAPSQREIVQRVLLEMRKVDSSGSGRPRDLTTLELVVLRLRQHALEGKTRAFKDFKALDARFGQQESDKKGGYLMIPEVGSWENWVRLFGPKEECPAQDTEE